MAHSEFSIRGFTGVSNIERMKVVYPQRFIEGETIISFGLFKGWTVEHINQFNHSYIVFLAALGGTKKWQEKQYGSDAIKKAISLTTKVERKKKSETLKFQEEQDKKIRWLLAFIRLYSRMHPNDFRDIRFLNSIRGQLARQMRIELITAKQLSVIGDIWEKHFGNKEKLLKKIKPYWNRKNITVEDVLRKE